MRIVQGPRRKSRTCRRGDRFGSAGFISDVFSTCATNLVVDTRKVRLQIETAVEREGAREPICSFCTKHTQLGSWLARAGEVEDRKLNNLQFFAPWESQVVDAVCKVQVGRLVAVIYDWKWLVPRKASVVEG